MYTLQKVKVLVVPWSQLMRPQGGLGVYTGF